VFKEVVNHK